MIKPHIDPYYAECSDDFVRLIIDEIQKKNRTKKQKIIKTLIRLDFYKWAIHTPQLLLHDSIYEWVNLVMTNLAYKAAVGN